MDKLSIIAILRSACSTLYKEQKKLIDEQANERAIVACLRSYLEHQFPGFEVVSEYNREGNIHDRQSKRDLKGKLIFPDLIIHQYGPEGINLVSVEVKGYWNPEPRGLDEEKLRAIRAKHGYKFLFRIELGQAEADLIEVE